MLEYNFDIPVLNRSKLIIYVGAYGSGKSELSVNTALYISERKNKGTKIFLVDLDMINPFYRSADGRKIIEEHGVTLLASQFANTNAEVSSIPEGLNAVFDLPEARGVLDIGGEDMGARVVGSLQDKLKNTSHELLMVINTNRPFTSNLEQIIKMKNELEASCNMRITGLVNNTNLLNFSSAYDILMSHSLIKEVSCATGVPYVFASGLDKYVNLSEGFFKYGAGVKQRQGDLKSDYSQPDALKSGFDAGSEYEVKSGLNPGLSPGLKPENIGMGENREKKFKDLSDIGEIPFFSMVQTIRYHF